MQRVWSKRVHFSFIVIIISVVSNPVLGVIRPSTAESLQELGEQIQMQIDEDRVSISDLQPMMIAEIKAETASTNEIRNALINQLQQYALNGQIAVCTGCGNHETSLQDGKTIARQTESSLKDVRKYLASFPNGSSYRSALWLEETKQGVTFRIVKIETGEILAANTIIAGQAMTARSQSNFTIAKNRQRIARGQSIFHTYFDTSLLLGNHFSVNTYEQWGYYGEHFAGVSFSLSTPVLGVGANYARVFPDMNNSLVGMKLLLSLPNAITSQLSEDSSGDDTFGDPLLTAMGFIRTPIGQSGEYGVFAFITHTARFGIGVSF